MELWVNLRDYKWGLLTISPLVLSCILHDTCFLIKFDYMWSFLVKKFICDINCFCVKILSVNWSILMWSTSCDVKCFLWKRIHVFCDHTFCDAKYASFLLSQIFFYIWKRTFRWFQLKLLELTSVSSLWLMSSVLYKKKKTVIVSWLSVIFWAMST